ncbi:MAG: LCP family protein [Clostridia bacterium]|nr:LCP family protein [Clostridia bacterium]
MKLKNFIIGHKVISAVIAAFLVVIISASAIFGGAIIRSINKINFVQKIPAYTTVPTNSSETAESGKSETDETTSAHGKKKKKSGEEMPDDITEVEINSSVIHNLDNNKIWHSDDVINILLAGIDYGSKKYPYGRSDSMIILSVNKIAKEVNIVSLSRAAYSVIPGYASTRLSHAHGYGDYPLMLQAIEINNCVDIDNFVSVGFDDFKKAIDILGGCKIEITSKEAQALNNALKRNNVENVGAGTYQLNGDLALEYARLRKIDTDWNRTERQRKVILSLINSAKNMSMNQLYDGLDSVLSCVTTDLTRSEIVEYIYASLSQYKNWPINQYIIPHISTPLTVVDEFEVLKLDKAAELEFLHNALYKDVPDENITLS